MFKAPFDDWLNDLKSLFAAANLDFVAADNNYNFYRAWDEYALTTQQAMDDYLSMFCF